MPAAPKKISFDDIRVGDTIRVVDVRDLKITDARQGFEVHGESGATVLRESRFHGAKRTFQLIDRESEPLPTALGSVIEISKERYVLVYDMFAPTNLWVHIGTGAKNAPENLQRKADLENGFEVIL